MAFNSATIQEYGYGKAVVSGDLNCTIYPRGDNTATITGDITGTITRRNDGSFTITGTANGGGLTGAVALTGMMYGTGKAVISGSIGSATIAWELYARGAGQTSLNDAGSNYITYLLLDRFTTPATAPLTSPRNAEPGPGQIAITDGTNIASVTSGRLVFNGTPATTSGFVLNNGATYSRQAGRAWLLTLPTRPNAGSNRIGWDVGNLATSNVYYGVQIGAVNYTIKDNSNASIDTVSAPNGNPLYFAFTQRGTGGFLLENQDGSNNYTLQWVYNTFNSAVYAKVFIGGTVAINQPYDDCRVIDLGSYDSRFATDYGLATSYEATTANGDTATMTADAIVEHTITAQTGVTQEIEIRRASDTSSVVVKTDQGGSTIGVYTRTSGGVDTLVGSTAAQTWTNGTQYRVVVIVSGTTIKTYVANSLKNSVTTNQNQAQTGLKVSHAGANLAAWPRTVTLANF